MNKEPYFKITQTSDINILENLIYEADHNTLFLFDIDNVVLMDEDEYRLTHPYREEWIKDIETRLSEDQRALLFSIILEERKVRLVDPNIRNIINELEVRKIPTMALTKLQTDKFGIIEKMQDWRIRELQGINIDFARLSPITDDIEIRELEVGSGIPLLTQGIILTAERDKADILEYVLANKNYYPESIVFVDDILENLESVQDLCKKLQINFEGFEYKRADEIPEIELDKKNEQIRFKILEQKYRWITDHQPKHPDNYKHREEINNK